ncbi:hypothetical protein [Allostreptomyces psammosilenae]|uniref:Uncharacterized protein n=1 Tax=Allostreptomyces psammosilenae TaxID=1892865 RepID=A0A852ZRV4_9ACTN|nr:hypothetical protein [Allostreptomyces psammosilenae]NYI04010.1 hypothetical protein [Allostreptomyces psammosilenae]
MVARGAPAGGGAGPVAGRQRPTGQGGGRGEPTAAAAPDTPPAVEPDADRPQPPGECATPPGAPERTAEPGPDLPPGWTRGGGDGRRAPDAPGATTPPTQPPAAAPPAPAAPGTRPGGATPGTRLVVQVHRPPVPPARHASEPPSARHAPPAPARPPAPSTAVISGAPPAPAAPVIPAPRTESAPRTAAPPRPHGAPPRPAPPAAPPPAPAEAAPPAAPAPRRPTRRRLRPAAAWLCVVTGLGLLAGSVVGGVWVAERRPEPPAVPPAVAEFENAADVWRNVPVDQLFPPAPHGEGAGRGRADRDWIRLGVRDDADCLTPLGAAWQELLADVGCSRLLRASYTDTARSVVTTVGVLITDADQSAAWALQREWHERGRDADTALLPPTLPVAESVATAFGPSQRASWVVELYADRPWVVYAVSGFADGRAVPEAVPADDALAPEDRSAVAESGIAHQTRALADLVGETFRQAAEDDWHDRSPSAGPAESRAVGAAAAPVGPVNEPARAARGGRRVRGRRRG